MSNEELLSVKGGASRGVILGTIGLVITFLIGVVDGYLRPLGC